MISFCQIELPSGTSYAGVGSRDTPNDVCADMTLIARRLEALGLTLNSGGAERADQAFERGVSHDTMKQIFLPWPGFQGSSSVLYLRGRHLDRQAREIAARFHPSWDEIVARANAAGADERTFKAARKARATIKLLTRNSYQILGADLKTPVAFGLCWTADGGPTGGTGQAIRVAEGNDIPMFNLFFPAVRSEVLSRLGIGPS